MFSLQKAGLTGGEQQADNSPFLILILALIFVFYSLFITTVHPYLSAPIEVTKLLNKTSAEVITSFEKLPKYLQKENSSCENLTVIDEYMFSRRPETKHVDCERVLQNDEKYAGNLATKRPRLIPRPLNMSCKALKSRVLPLKQLRSLKFGIAYARVVYESYELLEGELKSSYHSQNYFCYSVDRKAGHEFKSRIAKLSKCFTNVFVTSVQFDINRYGRFMNHAFYECLKLLITKSGWHYVLFMQNHDIMIKSVFETVAILESLGGANDVHVRPCEEERWNHSAKWDARSLKLYRNGVLESSATLAQLTASLTIARGAVHCSLSRSAVDWMVNVVNLSKLLDQLNIKVLGIDELLIPSLQVSDIFNMPGRFTGVCVKKGAIMGFITRHDVWYPSKRCRSGYFRHSVCVYGIEDFSWIASSPKLMANKMMPDFDYAVVDCVHELLFNRTHFNQDDHALNLTYYENQPYVRYHKNRLKPNPNYTLDCGYGMTQSASFRYSNPLRESPVKCP